MQNYVRFEIFNMFGSYNVSINKSAYLLMLPKECYDLRSRQVNYVSNLLPGLVG